MEKLGLNELRQIFEEFYVERGHYPGKSASLIPKNDKSLLLINSGMAPLKPYFSGLETPPSKRMVTCQKCIRTGDIDNVGKTSRHGTFFEMLGNFSFGDYFKEESIKWGWELLTEKLGMPAEKLWASVYLDDDEAVRIWREIGMPEERIVRLGKEDNFWEIGLGPCGPCSEIYFDRGEEYGCDNPDCKPGCECDRYIEIWNHVFTQFSKEEDGSYNDLTHPNIDTGMGLERLACVMQGVDSIFDIDTIRHILTGVTDEAGIEYKDGELDSDISVRIITDHLRSMVFMIADGILPSNEGRGYVLRRLIRRAARHGKLIGLKGNFLTNLSDKVVEVSGDAYPELREKQDYIKKIISIEEEKFDNTIDQGTQMIEKYIKDMKDSGNKVLDGEIVFKLYDTYGFPPELTQEILEEVGASADIAGFEKAMEKQKEMARKGRKSDEEEAWKEGDETIELPKTNFTGYSLTEDEGKVLAIFDKNGRTESAKEGQQVIVYLDETPFYGESGGQIYDTGIMSTDTMKAEVKSVIRNHGCFAHTIKIVEGKIKEGDSVNCKIDSIRRNHVARNHTATHLLHKALREVLGSHVTQAGSSVTPEGLRFDFSHFEAMKEEEITQVENLVNQYVNSFLPVTTEEMSMDEAVKKGAMALFDEKYGEKVRVVSCGNTSIELCGGTHLSNTGQVGCFKLVSESGVASGVRRIEAITGLAVLKAEKKNENLCKETASVLKCKTDNLKEKAVSITEELKTVKKELDEFKQAAMGSRADDLVKNAKDINEIKLITAKFDGYSVDDLRNITDDVKKIADNVVIVLAAVNEPKVNFVVSISDKLVEEGLHAGKMIKDIAKTCGGGGGGKADMAQAGGKDSSKVDEALALAENLIK